MKGSPSGDPDPRAALPSAGGEPHRLLAGRWAGEQVDRIGAIHIKDVFPDYLNAGTRQGVSYFAAQSSKRLWAEPGHGVVDFDAVLAAMPGDYDGDYMIEVDEPSVDDRFESMRRSYEWAVRCLPPREHTTRD